MEYVAEETWYQYHVYLFFKKELRTIEGTTRQQSSRNIFSEFKILTVTCEYTDHISKYIIFIFKQKQFQTKRKYEIQKSILRSALQIYFTFIGPRKIELKFVNKIPQDVRTSLHIFLLCEI